MEFKITYHVIPHDHSIIGPKGSTIVKASSMEDARNALIASLAAHIVFNPERDDLWLHMTLVPCVSSPFWEAPPFPATTTLPPQSDAPEGLG